MCLSAATRLLQSSQDFILTFSAATRPGLRASSERGNSAELDLKGHLTNSESWTMRRFVWAPGRRKHIKQYKQGGNCFSWHCPVSGKMSPKSIISLLYCILTWGCWWGWGGCRGGWAPAAPCWITRTQCLPCLIFWQKVLHLARNFCSFNTCFDNFAKFVERAGQSFNYPGARSGSSAVSCRHRWRPPPSWCGYIWNSTRS